MAWTEMARYRAGDPEGNVEEFVLEKDDDGNFRIRNDFGNSVFEFERMSGYELIRKLKRDMTQDIEKDLNDLWSEIDSLTADDCDSADGNLYPGSDIDSDHFGAD